MATEMLGKGKAMTKAVLFDSTLCVGCRSCESACAERWKLPYNEKIAAEERISAHKLTTVKTHGERFSRRMCMHCEEPACASVCPVGAFQKTALGPVVYDENKCMGCRYCMTACPHQVPSFTWNSRLPVIRKCDMCSDLAAAGKPTRCTEICPAEATLTGDRAAMIAEAQKRIKEAPDTYHPHVYGIEEAGGSSVLVIGGLSADKLGYPSNLPLSSLPALTWNVLQHIPDIVVSGAVLLSGVYWLTSRRERVAAEEGESHK